MTPKEDCETLLNFILPPVEKLLVKNKEFYPVGAILRPDGTAAATAVHDGIEFPDSKKVIDGLVEAHRKSALKGELKVSGIAWNGSVVSEGKESDAIIVSLEHRDGYSVIVGRTYRFGMFGKIKFGELFAQPGRDDVFGSSC